jgi:hypothetical protein
MLCFNLISNSVSANDTDASPMGSMPCENHQLISNNDFNADMDMDCCGDECACDCSLIPNSTPNYFTNIHGYQFFSAESRINISVVMEAMGLQPLPISPPPETLL